MMMVVTEKKFTFFINGLTSMRGFNGPPATHFTPGHPATGGGGGYCTKCCKNKKGARERGVEEGWTLGVVVTFKKKKKPRIT